MARLLGRLPALFWSQAIRSVKRDTGVIYCIESHAKDCRRLFYYFALCYFFNTEAWLFGHGPLGHRRGECHFRSGRKMTMASKQGLPSQSQAC